VTDWDKLAEAERIVGGDAAQEQILVFGQNVRREDRPRCWQIIDDLFAVTFGDLLALADQRAQDISKDIKHLEDARSHLSKLSDQTKKDIAFDQWIPALPAEAACSFDDLLALLDRRLHALGTNRQSRIAGEQQSLEWQRAAAKRLAALFVIAHGVEPEGPGSKGDFSVRDAPFPNGIRMALSSRITEPTDGLIRSRTSEALHWLRTDDKMRSLKIVSDCKPFRVP